MLLLQPSDQATQGFPPSILGLGQQGTSHGFERHR